MVPMRQHLLPALAALSLGGCGFFDLGTTWPPAVLGYPTPSMVRVPTAPAAAAPVLLTLQLGGGAREASLRAFEAATYSVAYLDQANAPIPALDVPRSPLPARLRAELGQPATVALDLASPAVVAWGRANRGATAISSLLCRVTFYGSGAPPELDVNVPIRFE